MKSAQRRSIGNTNLLLVVAVLLAVVAAGYFWLQTQQQPAQPQPSPTPTTAATPADMDNWKTYTTDKFIFRYPPDFIVMENEKDFFNVFPEEEMAPHSGLSIDARLSGSKVDFNKAVEKTKEGLVDLIVEEIDNGIRVSGVTGPGAYEGIRIVHIDFKYKQGAISAEYIPTDDERRSKIFDQILSTFAFIE